LRLDAMLDGLLFDLAIILTASFPMLFIARRLRLPSVFGFVVTGIIIGPHALGLIASGERVEEVAELGVALILFFIGLEFPLKRLRGLGRNMLISGTLQMTLTGIAIALLARATVTEEANVAILFGILAAASSGAVMIPIITERGEIGSAYAGRFLGVSLYQDLAIIPLILFLPALAGLGDTASPAAVGLKLLIAFGGVAALLLVARPIVPLLLNQLARLRNRESFTAGIVVVIAGIVALAELSGVSAAMGAFLAGVIVAENEYVHEFAATLRPFRDILSSLFFASIGMLLDLEFVIGSLGLVAASLGAVVAVKIAAAFIALRAASAVPRSALTAAFALATVGEFSFVIAQSARPLGLVTASAQQLLISTTVLTFALAPLLLSAGHFVARPLASHIRGRREKDEQRPQPLSGHVIVVGYGLNGKNVSRVMSQTSIPHLVIDEDAERIAEARATGVRALLADAAGAGALEAAGIDSAAAIVVAISDPAGARRITAASRGRNPNVRIIVRTRYVSEVDRLRTVGADEVIPEEFETSIEIISRILRLFHVPGNVLAAQTRILRDEAYRILRDPAARSSSGRRLAAVLAAGTSEIFLVMPDTCADGRTIDDLHIADDGVVVPALLRDGQPVTSPLPGETLRAGDMLLLVGAHDDLNRVIRKLEAVA
jgi:monovalent cation:H+ antiporter-2, CPA2 family